MSYTHLKLGKQDRCDTEFAYLSYYNTYFKMYHCLATVTPSHWKHYILQSLLLLPASYKNKILKPNSSYFNYYFNYT